MSSPKYPLPQRNYINAHCDTTRYPLAFFILKPDAFELNLVTQITEELSQRGVLARVKDINHPPEDKIAAHLAGVLKEHGAEVAERNRKFYAQGPIRCIILQSFTPKDPTDFITSMRAKVGPTDPTYAALGTIRCGAKDTLAQAITEKRALRNLIHASDSPEAVTDEIANWLGQTPFTLD